MAIFLSTIPNLSTSMRVKGAVYRIQFVPRDKPYNNGIFAVSDAVLVNAIRKHPYFGNVITELHEETDAPATSENKKAYVATYPDVTKSQEAREILVSQYNVSAETLTSKAAIKNTAEELNISFSNLQ